MLTAIRTEVPQFHVPASGAMGGQPLRGDGLAQFGASESMAVDPRYGVLVRNRQSRAQELHLLVRGLVIIHNGNGCYSGPAPGGNWLL